MQKILVILGPTATGKSSLAVELAKKYNGEIISADSRQVYKGMDIGTGKITKKEKVGIPHYMLDIISPKKVFSVAEWQKQTLNIISNIISRKKLPIICGGTGFYIQSIVNGTILPEVPPNKKLRIKLEKSSLKNLQKTLAKLDPRRFANIDINNPRRLIRAIEIATHLGKVPILRRAQGNNSYKFLQIGLMLSDKNLKQNIHNRLSMRLKIGMVGEAKKLHEKGLSWKRMRDLGLEYRYLAEHLENKLSKREFVNKLETEIWHYAKRQMTWFKRDINIRWHSPTDTRKIEAEVKSFLV